MKKIEWKDDYSVGVPLLDQQHQNLIKLINRLSIEGESGGMVSYVFDQLDQYVKEHFKCEEDLLKKAGYANFESHRDEHRAFEEWLRAVQQSHNMGGISAPLIAQTVCAYLQGWLITHILKSDMAYRDDLAD